MSGRHPKTDRPSSRAAIAIENSSPKIDEARSSSRVRGQLFDALLDDTRQRCGQLDVGPRHSIKLRATSRR